MTAKEYLRQALALKPDIERRQNQIIELQDMARRATSSYTAMRISGSRSRSKLEDAVIRIDTIANGLARDMARFAEKYQEISAAIDAVENPTYRRLLSMKYLEGKKFWEIAEVMHYSYYHMTHSLHPKALACVVVPKSST